MKYLNFIFIITLFISACNKNNLSEFNEQTEPVFYVIAQNGKPAFAYVGESRNMDNNNSVLPETDTSRTKIKMFKNNIFKENLHTDSAVTVSNYGDTILLYNKGLVYVSTDTLENNESYSFNLKYKDYPVLDLEVKIPPFVPIDSFKIIPNIAYAFGEYAIQHNLTVYFHASTDRHLHYMTSVYIDYDTTGMVDGGSVVDDFGNTKYFEDDEINFGGNNALTYTILSEKSSGDFKPIIYLFTISDGYYNAAMREKHYEEYRQNASYFDYITPYYPIYSMLPNAYANIYAFSKDSCDNNTHIHIEEPAE